MITILEQFENNSKRNIEVGVPWCIYSDIACALEYPIVWLMLLTVYPPFIYHTQCVILLPFLYLTVFSILPNQHHHLLIFKPLFSQNQNTNFIFHLDG